MTKTRLAIAGAGVIGKRHMAAMAQCDRVELVGLADPSDGAADVAKATGVPLFADVESLIAALRPDGVVVATPTEHHHAPTSAILQAGCHALVEKPVMATLAEADGIVALSQSTGMQVLVGHQRRYYDLVARARALVQGGTLGQLVAVSGQWTMRKHAAYYDPDWRKGWKAGPILTNLIHEIDLLRHICGEVVSISAETANTVLGFEKEDTAAVILRFQNGALGTFILSDQATSPWSWELAIGENAAFPPTGQNATRFMGTKAALDFPNLVLWHHGRETPDWTHQIEAHDCPTALEDPYIAQIRHFADVIAGTASPRITAEDATRSLRATLAVYDAAESGKRVVLPVK